MSFHKLSRILGPLKSGDPVLINLKYMNSKSGKLFSDKGLVRLNDGKATLLPLMVRAMMKLKNIIREEMEKISAYEISLPILIKESLMKEGVWNEAPELFRMSDRSDKKYVLSPTSEEAIIDLLAREKLNENSFPVRFYQINTKFRDEIQARYSLIRLKEFVMKDLYCFDSCPESCNNTYDEILQHYHKIFERLQLPFVCANSDGSHMYSIKSHEFHVLSDVGEGNIIMCKNCGENTSGNMVKDKNHCPNCSHSNITIEKGIEVGHTFNFGASYSEKMNAKFYKNNGDFHPLEMSSYGLGITRILGASVEILSTENQLRWPLPISPYSICVILPKAGSKEEETLGQSTNDICANLSNHFKGDVVVDDRTLYTIGKRLIQTQDLGFPFIVVIGRDMLNDSPKIEIFDVNANEKHLIHPSDAVGFISSKISEHK